MAERTMWAGLDLGIRTTHVCIIDDNGVPLRELSCETTAQNIAQALSVQTDEKIEMVAAEAGTAPHVIRKLREAGFAVGVFEARKASKFLAIRRSKTDASDAHGLADLARLGRNTISQVHLKSLECQQIRGKLVLRQRLVRTRVATENLLRSQLALYGRHVERWRSAEPLRDRVTTQLLRIRAEEGIDLRDELEPLIVLCDSLKSYLKAMDRALEQQASDHPVCRRLRQVTGVGPICSLSFYSAIEDPRRFRHASDVAAYLGLVPRRYQSGDASYTRGITKTGNRMTRTHLVNAAMVFGSRGPDSDLKAWAATLKKRIGSRRSRVALARKLSIILLTIWKNEAQFEPHPSRVSRPAL